MKKKSYVNVRLLLVYFKKSLFITIFQLILFPVEIFSQELTKNVLDPYSTNSLFVIVKNGKDTIMNGTAFTVQIKNTIYLVTNSHIAGGEYYVDWFRQNKGRLPLKNEIPDSIIVRFYNKELFSYTYYSIAVNKNNLIKFYADEKSPSIQNIFDMVAIKLPSIDTNSVIINPYTINDFNPSLNKYPGSELFVVGFPLDYGKSSLLYPIWKRGTIASDPNFNWFYIDATTRSGMSGSPVIYRGSSFTTTNNSYSAGSIYTFIIGIYFKQDAPSEIGAVTKIDFLFDKLIRITD